MAEKVWTEEYVKELPDECFACVTAKERYLPHHAKDGTLDESHLRNALARAEIKAAVHLLEHAKTLDIKSKEQENMTEDEKENDETKEEDKPTEPEKKSEEPEAPEKKTESIDSQATKNLRNKLVDCGDQRTALETRIEELEAENNDLKAKLNKPVTAKAESDHENENTGVRALKILMRDK